MSIEQEEKFGRTHYIVFSEPSVFHAVRIYGVASEKVRIVLEAAEPQDHLAAIKREIAKPSYDEQEKNLSRIMLAELATTAAVEYAREKTLQAKMDNNSYPIEAVVKIR